MRDLFISALLSTFTISVATASETIPVDSSCETLKNAVVNALAAKEHGESLDQVKSATDAKSVTDAAMASFLSLSIEEVFKDPVFMSEALQNGKWTSACNRAADTRK